MTWITEEMSDLAGAFPLLPAVVNVNQPNQWFTLCKANPLRWGLMLTLAGPAAGSVNVWPDSSAPVGTGFALAAGEVILFDFRTHPGLTRAAWYASSGGIGNNQIGVIEELSQQ